mgnify:CR=1 FL=1
MLSDSIKYKDLRSEKHTYKSEIGSKRIKKILILYSGRLQISRHISLIATYPSARSRCYISVGTEKQQG